MTYTHTECKPSSWFSGHGIEVYSPKARDRRNAVQSLFGEWFRDHDLKLKRDYMVVFEQTHLSLFSSPHYSVHISIKDPKKAMLFKLTWA